MYKLLIIIIIIFQPVLMLNAQLITLHVRAFPIFDREQVLLNMYCLAAFLVASCQPTS